MPEEIKTNLDTKYDLIKNLNNIIPNGVGVEIGVLFGHFSKFILENWNCKELHSVDPWIYQAEYTDYSNANNETNEKRFTEAKGNLELFGDRSIIHRMFSKEFADQTQDESIDFVYLDARHDYKAILDDINLWYPKVKRGGVFAGHDYVNNGNPHNVIEVKSAVDDWIKITNHELYLTKEPGFPSWWIIK